MGLQSFSKDVDVRQLDLKACCLKIRLANLNRLGVLKRFTYAWHVA